MSVIRDASAHSRETGFAKSYISELVSKYSVLYDYQPDRRAKRLAAFLKEFKGYLHTDGYDGYHSLSDDIVIVGCLAHARRKFDEALKSMPEKDREGSNVFRGKLYMDKLFELERAFVDLTPKERFAKRQELEKPILDVFFCMAR